MPIRLGTGSKIQIKPNKSGSVAINSGKNPVYVIFPNF
jgi:hypothetical protein